MSHKQVFGVLGPAGFTGSHVCVELLHRGCKVVGISRHPEAIGKQENYVPRAFDIENSSIAELVEAFSDLDVVISAYGPHTEGAGALQYKPFLEVVRKLVLAVKHAKVKYFVFVGGAGSLHVPGTIQVCAVDHPDFFIAYRRALADSEAHTSYMEERLGHMGTSLRKFRNCRIAERNGTATPETRAWIIEYEEIVKNKDNASDFIQAGRTSFMFFDGNISFPWTYVSPSPLYRPGSRTGKYKVFINDIPLKGDIKSDNIFDGRLTGISAADLAIAIVDEAQQRTHQGLHWTAVADLSDDSPAPSYLKIDTV